MALTAGSQALYSDVDRIFSQLNAERVRRGYSSVSRNTSKGGSITAAGVNQIRSFIGELSAISPKPSNGANDGWISQATAGQPIKVGPLSNSETVLGFIREACSFNSFGFTAFTESGTKCFLTCPTTFFTYFGFGFFTGSFNGGFGQSTCSFFSFNFNFNNGVCNVDNATFFSSFAFNSSDNSFNSADNGFSFCGSHNASAFKSSFNSSGFY